MLEWVSMWHLLYIRRLDLNWFFFELTRLCGVSNSVRCRWWEGFLNAAVHSCQYLSRFQLLSFFLYLFYLYFSFNVRKWQDIPHVVKMLICWFISLMNCTYNFDCSEAIYTVNWFSSWYTVINIDFYQTLTCFVKDHLLIVCLFSLWYQTFPDLGYKQL